MLLILGEQKERTIYLRNLALDMIKYDINNIHKCVTPTVVRKTLTSKIIYKNLQCIANKHNLHMKSFLIVPLIQKKALAFIENTNK